MKKKKLTALFLALLLTLSAAACEKAELAGEVVEEVAVENQKNVGEQIDFVRKDLLEQYDIWIEIPQEIKDLYRWRFTGQAITNEMMEELLVIASVVPAEEAWPVEPESLENVLTSETVSYGEWTGELYHRQFLADDRLHYTNELHYFLSNGSVKVHAVGYPRGTAEAALWKEPYLQCLGVLQVRECWYLEQKETYSEMIETILPGLVFRPFSAENPLDWSRYQWESIAKQISGEEMEKALFEAKDRAYYEAETVETLIASRFPVTAEEMREKSKVYDAELNAYGASPGMGGAPAAYRIIETTEENDVLTLVYELYAPDWERYYTTCTTVIDLSGDTWKYISHDSLYSLEEILQVEEVTSSEDVKSYIREDRLEQYVEIVLLARNMDILEEDFSKEKPLTFGNYRWYAVLYYEYDCNVELDFELDGFRYSKQETVEALVMKYFDVQPEDIRANCQQYDPELQAYRLPTELGGFAPSFKIVDAVQEENQVKLQVNLYNEYYEMYSESELVVELQEDGSWKYISNPVLAGSACMQETDNVNFHSETFTLNPIELETAEILETEELTIKISVPDHLSFLEFDGRYTIYQSGEEIGTLHLYLNEDKWLSKAIKSEMAFTSDFFDLSDELGRPCYLHVTRYPAKLSSKAQRTQLNAYWFDISDYCMCLSFTAAENSDNLNSWAHKIATEMIGSIEVVG